jgi:glycosyltransferase involved in cell wall biosynthesis
MISQSTQRQFYDVLKNLFAEDKFRIITGDVNDKNVIKSPAYDKTNIKTKFLSWVKFFRFVTGWGRNHKKTKIDMVVASSNPPINIWLGLYLKKIYHCKLVFFHWDIYPQSIEHNVNNILGRIVSKLWGKWADKNYPKVDLMIANGPMAKEYIIKSRKSNFNIVDMPFSVDVDYLQPVSKEDNKFLKKNGIEDKLVVLYSGTMGVNHNIDIILRTAKKLNEYEDIVFVFIGQGARRKEVERYIEEENPKNVMLFPLQDSDIYPYSMACGDIGIVSQDEKGSLLQYPSKAFSYMACGEAIIGIGRPNSDLYELLNNNDIGVFVGDDSADTLATAILDLYNNGDKLDAMKKNSRTYAEEKLAVDVVTEKYKKLFERKFNW